MHELLVNRPGIVRRLKKSLYDLKQPLRCWFSKLAASLTVNGFFNHTQITLCSHCISSNNSFTIASFKSYLGEFFHMKDLGTFNIFLALRLLSVRGIYFCQRKYTLDIVIKDDLLGSKPPGFPIEHNYSLALADSALILDPESYRSLVGRLIYFSFMQEPC